MSSPRYFRSERPEDNLDIARRMLRACGDSRAFALSGDLGAGKTELVRSFCQALGVRDPVSSPSYSLIHEYRSPEGPVYHLDLYRLRDEAEALEAGAWECVDSGYFCFIEWPERLPELIPGDAARIHISIGQDGNRTLELSC
jgi:tRNA threonylcarbamoyladenosine biosynthesis protein TsaE